MPHPKGDLPVEWVTEDIIRQYFNDGQFVEKLKSGQLVAHTKRSSHPNKPPRGEPICTWSQIVYYCTLSGRTIAIVHQYLRPDGTIGASGLPDPKSLILKDKIISVRFKRPAGGS